jgi:signal transduction histidine kinase/putative methionine-R-sulfoxide reductase with GAF domain
MPWPKALGEAMRRRSKAGSKLAKARYRKLPARKRRDASTAVTRPRSTGAGGDTRATRLARELDQALQQQAATSEILQVISSSAGDLQPVFATILEKAVRLCSASFGNIYRWEDEALHLVATHNTPPALAEVRRRSPLRPFPQSFVARMVATKAAVNIPDLAAEQFYIERNPSAVAAVELADMRSILLVPMMRKNDLVGAISVYRQRVRPFTHRQIALLAGFANQAVIAIENARLLTELRARGEELSRSVDELRMLAEVSQAVNKTLDLETVLSTIAAKAVQLSSTDAGAIYVFDDAQRLFHLRATYGMDRELIDALTHRQIGLDDVDVALPLTRGELVQIADLRREAATPLNQIILAAGYRALLAAPLMRGADIVGVLVIRRRTPGFFTHNSVDLVKTFAAQSALAVQNARLFDNVRARTRELAKSIEMLQHERNNKLMNLEAMAASISHEVKQPLAAITMNGSAALRYLRHTPPDLEEAQLALGRIVSDCHRASQVFDSIRDLFSKADEGREQIDINQLARDVLHTLHEQLNDRRITIDVKLPPEMPLVTGHRGQLQEVLVNLVNNAIEAMDDIGHDRRILRLSAEHHGDGAIVVAVEDSGSGIDPTQADKIFDAFVTTKPRGMGLGLAICRMIVERHEGQLIASPASPHGSVFRVVLPTRTSAVEST